MNQSSGSQKSPARRGGGEPGSARGRGALETRRRLVSSGTECFAARGLHATTILEIARGAGVAAGTFYLHFEDKSALFREIALDAFERLRVRLARASARADGDPVAALRLRAEELLDFAAESRPLIGVLFGRAHEAAELADDIVDYLVQDIEAGLRRRIAAGESRPLDPEVTAQGLAGLWVRVVSWWAEDPSRAPRERVVETLVALHPFSFSRRQVDA
jgi:AcrR family transcriptional regulator